MIPDYDAIYRYQPCPPPQTQQASNTDTPSMFASLRKSASETFPGLPSLQFPKLFVSSHVVPYLSSKSGKSVHEVSSVNQNR